MHHRSDGGGDLAGDDTGEGRAAGCSYEDQRLNLETYVLFLDKIIIFFEADPADGLFARRPCTTPNPACTIMVLTAEELIADRRCGIWNGYHPQSLFYETDKAASI